MAKEPFSDSIKEAILPLLSDIHFINGLVHDLHNLFEIDPGFDLSTFHKQMSVLRGQVVNLVAALRDSKSPYDLVRMPVLTLEPSIKKRSTKSRWPHQRFAAGLAQGENTFNDIQPFESYTDHRINNIPSNSIQTNQQSVLTENCIGNLIGYDNSLGVDNIQPTSSSTRTAVDDIVVVNDDDDDDKLEHGLVALPTFRNKQTILNNTSDNGQIEVDLADSAGDDIEDGNEQRFNLRYYKKPFFTWF
ncbi:unnamed protein product [Heterobilharzia americana]|nr:unnamed protein product [Heterobilharzia americana]